MKHKYLPRENHMSQKLEYLPNCFPVKIEVVFERNTSCQTEGSWWIKAYFFPKRPIQLCWRNTCVSRTQRFLLDAVASSHCFPVRMVVVLAKVLPATLMFQSEYRLSLIQIGLFSSGEETHAPLQRKAWMLARAASSILFSIVNWGSYWEEHFLQNIDFKVQKGWFCSKEATSVEWTKHTHFSKKTMCPDSKSIRHILSLLKLSSFLKGILPANQNCQGGERLIWSK
jgi:hypothetical protein